jgi:hypothetical protein
MALRTTQTKDERLREVSRAVIEAKMLGAGLIMISPTDDYKWIPIVAVVVDQAVVEAMRRDAGL